MDCFITYFWKWDLRPSWSSSWLSCATLRYLRWSSSWLCAMECCLLRQACSNPARAWSFWPSWAAVLSSRNSWSPRLTEQHVGVFHTSWMTASSRLYHFPKGASRYYAFCFSKLKSAALKSPCQQHSRTDKEWFGSESQPSSFWCWILLSSGQDRREYWISSDFAAHGYVSDIPWSNRQYPWKDTDVHIKLSNEKVFSICLDKTPFSSPIRLLRRCGWKTSKNEEKLLSTFADLIDSPNLLDSTGLSFHNLLDSKQFQNLSSLQHLQHMY